MSLYQNNSNDNNNISTWNIAKKLHIISQFSSPLMCWVLAHFIVIDIPSISPICLIYHLCRPLECKLHTGRDFCLPFFPTGASPVPRTVPDTEKTLRSSVLDERINSSGHTKYLIIIYGRKIHYWKKYITNLQMGKGFHYCQRAVTLQPGSRNSSNLRRGVWSPGYECSLRSLCVLTWIG